MSNTETLVGCPPAPSYNEEVYCQKRKKNYLAQAFNGVIHHLITICLAVKDSSCEGCPYYHIFKP